VWRERQVSGNGSSFRRFLRSPEAKVSVEITSPLDGVLNEILVKEGGVVKVGEPLCLIETEDGEEADLADAALSDVQPGRVPVAPLSTGPTPVLSTDSSPQPTTLRRHHPLDPNRPAEQVRSTPDEASAIPSVRHFATEDCILDLPRLMPRSGKNGRIEKSDVEAYLAGGATSTPKLTLSQPNVTPQGEDLVVKLERTRYGMWKAMVKVIVQYIGN